MDKRIVLMKPICSLDHCECDSHAVHKLSQRRLTADLLVPRESDCSRRRSKVSSYWLPSYIKATRPVLEVYKTAEFFQGSPRSISLTLWVFTAWYVIRYRKKKTRLRLILLWARPKVSKPKHVARFILYICDIGIKTIVRMEFANLIILESEKWQYSSTHSNSRRFPPWPISVMVRASGNRGMRGWVDPRTSPSIVEERFLHPLWIKPLIARLYRPYLSLCII